MNRWQWVLVLVGIVALGCSRESADELFTKGEAATHRDSTYADAASYLGEFLKRYPDDPRADVALQALGRVLLNQGKADKAISCYEELVRRFPSGRYADQAQFMIGYIYDQTKRYQEARTAYQKVIDHYPHSDLVDDARISIAHLGKSPDAWFHIDSTAVHSSLNR